MPKIIVSAFAAVLAAFVFAVATPTPAHAKCTGSDMLPELRSADPDGIKGVFDRAAAVPNAKGLFWKIEKPGIATSFMYGTYHSSQAVDIVPPAVWTQLEQASSALFEMDRDQQQQIQRRMATDPSFSVDLSAPPLLPALPDEKRAVVEDALRQRGVPVEAANFMRPWLLMSLLGMPACHVKALMGGDKVLDDIMMGRAEGKGIPVYGLETYEEALAGFSALRRDQLIDMIMPSNDWSDREEDFFAMLLAIYASEQPVVINEISIYLSEKLNPAFDARTANQTFMVKLLDDRNRAWMDDLAPHLDKGNAFIAVGALHLPGEAGLVELLRAQGWTVTVVN